MKIEINYDSTYVEKLSHLIQAIRKEAGDSDSWKESLYEKTEVFYAHSLIYPEWVVGTTNGYIGVYNEMAGRQYSETFDVSERPDFDPEDIFWDMELDEFIFTGTFIDACRFILDVTLKKWREFGVFTSK